MPVSPPGTDLTILCLKSEKKALLGFPKFSGQVFFSCKPSLAYYKHLKNKLSSSQVMRVPTNSINFFLIGQVESEHSEPELTVFIK